MAKIITRSQLMNKLATNRRRLEKNIAHLNPQELQQAVMANGWSAKDILAHLADWEQLHLGWVKAARAGENPLTPAPGFTWKVADLDRLNHQIYEAHRHKSLAEVLAFFNGTHQAFIRQAEALSDEELFTPGYYAFTGSDRLFDWLLGFANHDAWGQKFTLKLMRSHAPQKDLDRSEIISRLHAERRRLENNLAQLTPAELVEPGAVGTWSLKDMLSHLAEWESLLPAWIAAARSGVMVVTPAPDLTWKQLNIFNERIYQKHKDASLQEVLDFFRGEHAKFMELLECLPDEEVLIPGFFNFTGNSPLYSWLAAYAAHDRWGKTEIRQWIKKREVVAK